MRLAAHGAGRQIAAALRVTQLDEVHSLEHEEAAALYALRLLTGRDRRAFESHLAACAACQRLVSQDRDTVMLLLEHAPQADAPPAFRDRLVRRLDQGTADAPPGRNLRVLRPMRRPARARWQTRILAVAAALALTFGAGIALGRQYTASQVLLRVPLEARSSSGSAAVIVHASGEAELELRGLPDPSPGHVYEAWMVDQAGVAQMAGVYDDGDGTFRMERSPLGRRLEVTLEPAPLSQVPTAPPLFAALVAP